MYSSTDNIYLVGRTSRYRGLVAETSSRHIQCCLVSGMNGKRVLLVDDEPVFAKATATALRNEGFEVIIAEDGAAAMSTLRQGKPDLILLDIVFPPDVAHGGGVSWDGFLIMDWLRRMGGIGNTPVLMMTGADPSQYVERARKAGARGLFPKTVERGELIRVVHQILDESVATA